MSEHDDEEAKARAARHSIYKEGTCTREQVSSGMISRDKLMDRGFVEDPVTGDWQRPRREQSEPRS